METRMDKEMLATPRQQLVIHAHSLTVTLSSAVKFHPKKPRKKIRKYIAE